MNNPNIIKTFSVFRKLSYTVDVDKYIRIYFFLRIILVIFYILSN